MKGENSTDILLATLKNESPNYGFTLSTDELKRLASFYELLEAWNTRLHLVAPCSAKEFATRHLLESMFLTNYLPNNATVVDVGSGAGLPIIPCLIVRSDLRATLIESSKKKAVFLREALKQVGVSESATVIAERFETLSELKADIVTSRALDKFEVRLAELVNWSPKTASLLLYGGPSMRKKLQQLKLGFAEELLANSVRRFLFTVKPH
ncbi:MAG TPA: 16S rRNA (guanine(527)-N(7))-methyltransferase RsmG [Pyrinomonadaceae bacterium]|nr:16S rRNA (guanine(527)-N(7))-methyltransferase RsmG [Pyrinomonadaceae bacterium]